MPTIHSRPPFSRNWADAHKSSAGECRLRAEEGTDRSNRLIKIPETQSDKLLIKGGASAREKLPLINSWKNINKKRTRHWPVTSLSNVARTEV